MSDIPNFVYQVQKVEQKLLTEWNSVQNGWQDIVAEHFTNRDMEPYLKNFPQYITGDEIGGYGLDRLLQLMNQHLQDMDSLFND